MEILSVNMLGIPSIRIDETPVVLPYRKAEALLYYLILKKKVSRSDLIGLLWADFDTTTALRNLRHAIYTIRKALETDIFLSGPRTLLELRPDLPLRCDVSRFLEDGTLNLYRGEFLQGFSLHQEGLFENWLSEQRNLFHLKYLSCLLAAQKEALNAGDLPKAEQYGLRYLENDSMDEDVTVTLMQVYSAQQKFRKAIELYHALRQTLSDEFGIAPLKSTTALYYRIVDLWNSSAEKEVELSSTLLLGKERPLRRLRALCSDAESRSSVACLLIEGEAGVGKTCLLNHFLDHFDLSDQLVLRSCCYPSETDIPLAPWNAVMLSLMSELKNNRISLPPSALHTASGLFPCLSAGIPVSDMAPAGHYPLQLNYGASLENALLLLSMSAQQVPLLLVFEDLHWMDAKSVSMLSLLLHRLHALQLTVLCTARTIVPTHVRDFFLSSERDKLLERHTLKNFTFEETTRFVAAADADRSCSEERLREIYHATGGNALLLVQLLNSYQDGSDPSVVPAGLQKLMNSRLSNLSSEERQVLDLVSIFTEWVSFDTLNSILTLKTLELTYVCHQLCQRMLLQESTKNGTLHYMLAHEQIRLILTQQQSASARRILHLRVAQQLEAQLPIQPAPVYDRLIYHYDEGGDRVKVFQYRVLALNAYTGLSYALLPTLRESAGAQSADNTDLSGYLRALDADLVSLRCLHPDNPLLDSAELLLLHSQSRYHIYGGNYSEGLKNAGRLTELSVALHDSEMFVRAQLQFVYYGIQTYSTAVMETHLKAVEPLLVPDVPDAADASGDPDPGCRMPSAEYGVYLRLSGLLHLMRANYSAARALLSQSIQFFRQLDSSAQKQYEIHIAGAYNYIAESYRLERNYAQAFQYYEQAIRYNRSLGYYPGTAVFFTNYGVAAFQSGDRASALRNFQHAQKLYSASHEYSGYPIALSYLALYQAESGDFADAAEKLREAFRISELIASPWWKGIALYVSWKIRTLPALRSRALNASHGAHAVQGRCAAESACPSPASNSASAAAPASAALSALSALWPADPAEHLRTCLSCLTRLPPTLEAEEMEAEQRGGLYS